MVVGRLEHGVYSIGRVRDGAMNRYRGYQIPWEWMQDTGIVSQVNSLLQAHMTQTPILCCYNLAHVWNRRGRDSQSFVKVCLRVLGSYSDHVPNECLDKVPENALQLAAATTTSLLSSSEFRLVPFSLPWKQKHKNDYRSAIS
jgi:hypothetical protein